MCLLFSWKFVLSGGCNSWFGISLIVFCIGIRDWDFFFEFFGIGFLVKKVVFFDGVVCLYVDIVMLMVMVGMEDVFNVVGFVDGVW